MTRTVAVRVALAVLGTILVVAVVAVLYATREGDGGGDTRAGSGDAGGEAEDDGGWYGALVTDPAARPEFTLTDTAGQPYDFGQETAGQLTLLFFGYTNCPDVCPLQMATLATALEEPGVPDPVVVFVTTDPARDTPDHLREWLDNFDTDFVGLTGTAEEIRAAEDAALVEPSIPIDTEGRPLDEPPAGGQDYEIGHAAQIVVYTSDDLTHIVYPAGVQSDAWVADLPRLAEGWTAA